MPALSSGSFSNLPNNPIGFRLPGWEEKPHWPALLVLLVLWATHMVATWHEATVFWGDYGRWLYEMDRFAHGEVPYRDFKDSRLASTRLPSGEAEMSDLPELTLSRPSARSITR